MTEITPQSKKFTLNSIDWKNIAKGALIAAAGALLTYLTEVVASVDFGDLTPVVVSGWSIAVNIFRKYLTGL